MSLLTVTTVQLQNKGDNVKSSEFFSVSQGFYAQTSPPDVGNGNVVNFGIETLDTGSSYTITFTNNSGPTWFIGGSYAGAFASGSYSDGDLFAIYANPQEVVFTQNGTVIQKYPDADLNNIVPSLGSAYKMSLLYAFKNGGGAINFPKSIFYPAGSRGTQGRTFTTLQVASGSASITTPTAFTLTANGDSVTTQESLAAIQGIYLQTRLPELQNIGDSVTIGFKGTSGTADFFLVYTKDTNVGVEAGTDYTISVISYGGSPQPIGYSGRTYPGNVWSLYLDHKVLIVSLEGSPFGDPFLYVTDYDTQYQYSATFTTSSSTTPVAYKDVMFYPTGSPGKDGASTVTFNAFPNNYRVLTPNSVRLVKSGNNNTFTNESFDGNTEGIYCQFVVPQITGAGESITVQIQDIVTLTPYYGIQFDMNGFTCVSSQSFLTNGNYTTTAYNGLIFSIYSDGTTVYLYNNGVEIASAPYGSGTYFMNIIAVGATVNENEPGVLYFSQPYDITNIRFYPTGKLGLQGATGPQGIPGTAGGLVLYLNAPTETINSNTYYQLDNALSSSQQTYSATISANSSGTLTRRFIVTSGNTPAVIPGGLWDLNVWAYDSATAGIQMYFMVKVITNLGGAVSTLLASSNVVNINGTTSAEYILSGYIPTTAIATGNRVVVEIYANNTNGAGHNLTYQWGFSTTPSHIHTSISIAITGAPGATGAGGALGYYGNFLNSVSQTFTANTNTAFLLNGNVESNGVSIDPGVASRVVVANAGTYNFQFSAQLYAGSGATNFIIWYRINGTDIAQSATDIYLKNNEYAVASWNFVQTMTAGQYFQLMGLAVSNSISVQALSAVTGPPAYPAIPSVILTVTQVMYTQIGPSGPTGPSGPSGPSGVSGVSGPSGPSGPSGVSGVSGPSGPSGPSGVSGVSGPSGVSGVSGPVGPVASSISTSSITGTSLTSGTTPAISTSTYGTYYYLTNSGFNALTLPTTTAGSTVGSYWVLRNNTSTYLSIAVTNNANITTPLVIPPSNATTIVVTTASSSPAYTLF